MIEDLNNKLNLLLSHGCNLTVVRFIELHSYSACRVSDLLNIKRSDISTNLVLTIKQGKGSAPLVVRLMYNLEFWKEYKSGLHADISSFNRNYFYRLYKRYNIMIDNGINNNNTVTHVFRKLVAQDVFEATNDIEAVQSVLGHKSVNSSVYYLSNEQSKRLKAQNVFSQLSGSTYNVRISKNYNKSVIRLMK